MKPASLIAIVFLSLIAVLHLFRLLFQVQIIVDGTVVPVWASLFAFLLPGLLALLLWREQKQ